MVASTFTLDNWHLLRVSCTPENCRHSYPLVIADIPSHIPTPWGIKHHRRSEWFVPVNLECPSNVPDEKSTCEHEHCNKTMLDLAMSELPPRMMLSRLMRCTTLNANTWRHLFACHSTWWLHARPLLVSSRSDRKLGLQREYAVSRGR